MINNLTNSYKDESGQWWYLQPSGVRQRARVITCGTCKKEYLGYPTKRLRNYCSTECYRKSCKKCGKEFAPKTIRQSYCSVECKHKTAVCKNCKTEFLVTKGSKGIFCSNACGYDHVCPIGSKIKDSSGYMIIKVPNGTPGAKMPGRGRKHWMWEHRYVMQNILGRALEKFESVHHINGIRDDNRPENLELWKRSQPAGIRSKDYHCPGCRCHEHQKLEE